jgi:HSP20 family protein
MWEDNVWDGMRKMRRRMDKMFTNLGEGIRKAWADFDETDEEFILNVELPGIEKEDIKLNVFDKAIEISAEKKVEIKKKARDGEEYGYKKTYRGFARNVELPDNADLSKVVAEYKNGILNIRIKKKEGSKKKRIVEVK